MTQLIYTMVEQFIRNLTNLTINSPQKSLRFECTEVHCDLCDVRWMLLDKLANIQRSELLATKRPTTNRSGEIDSQNNEKRVSSSVDEKGRITTHKAHLKPNSNLEIDLGC